MGICIGGVALANPVILAPMSGVTDLPFRRQVKRLGAGLVVSEMIASGEMIRATRQSLRKAATAPEEAPVAIQLAGTEPALMAEAARLMADRGAALIDLNFGCPAKKVVKKAAGSALMREEGLAAAIMAAVVAAVDVPVTVKMRTGWDDASRNAPRLARLAEDCGVAMISVHGRTRCQLYTGTADWGFIAAVKDAVSIPVVANGDVRDVEDARRCLELSGADGVMVGRGCQGRPWFAGQVAAFLETGAAPTDPPDTVQRAIVHEHFAAMLSHYSVEGGVRAARKHMGWYAQGRPGAATFRNAVNNTLDPARVHALVDGFFGAPVRLAA